MSLAKPEGGGVAWEETLMQHESETRFSPAEGWPLQLIPQLHGIDMLSLHSHGLLPQSEIVDTVIWTQNRPHTGILQSIFVDRGASPLFIGTSALLRQSA
jgi:hypothetical protein